MSIHSDNKLLAALPSDLRNAILAKCQACSLPVKTPLYRPNEVPPHAYFMTSGFASVVASTPEGDTAEVGIIGSEGLVGSFHLIGPAPVQTDCFIQSEATGLQLAMPDLRDFFRGSPELHTRVLEFVQHQGLTLSQIAGCHRLHEAEERLARWLLMAQDRTQTEVLNLTQEFLGMMLGARRTTVTMIAGAMQRSGLIEYNRGRVRILNRDNLEAAACSCYMPIKNLYDNLYKPDVSSR